MTQAQIDGKAPMKEPRTWGSIVFSDLGILILLGLLRFVPLLLTNGQTVWHRDELDTLDNARYLAWSYVAYPPLAPFNARIPLTLFGPSITGVRFFSTLSYAISMVLTGLMAREIGGRRWAQVIAAVAVAIAPYALLGVGLFHYSSFDYLWWVRGTIKTNQEVCHEKNIFCSIAVCLRHDGDRACLCSPLPHQAH